MNRITLNAGLKKHIFSLGISIRTPERGSLSHTIIRNAHRNMSGSHLLDSRDTVEIGTSWETAKIYPLRVAIDVIAILVHAAKGKPFNIYIVGPDANWIAHGVITKAIVDEAITITVHADDVAILSRQLTLTDAGVPL